MSLLVFAMWPGNHCTTCFCVSAIAKPPLSNTQISQGHRALLCVRSFYYILLNLPVGKAVHLRGLGSVGKLLLIENLIFNNAEDVLLTDEADFLTAAVG